MSEVVNIKTTGKRTPRDFWIVKHYDVFDVVGTQKLIAPITDRDVMRYYVSAEELFDVLDEMHTKVGQ